MINFLLHNIRIRKLGFLQNEKKIPSITRRETKKNWNTIILRSLFEIGKKIDEDEFVVVNNN